MPSPPMAGTPFGAGGKFTVAIYFGLALVLFVFYPILVRSHGLSVKQYFSGVWPAVQLGFVSRSSIGTLPLTQRVTERNLGVPSGYASFAVPLGATTKMDGCAAIYPAVSAIFVAQFFDVQLTLTDYLLIALVSVLGSAATAGTTGAVVMLTLTLSTLGLPLAGVGLLLAVSIPSLTWAAQPPTWLARRWFRPSWPSAKASWTSRCTTLLAMATHLPRKMGSSGLRV